MKQISMSVSTKEARSSGGYANMAGIVKMANMQLMTAYNLTTAARIPPYSPMRARPTARKNETTQNIPERLHMTKICFKIFMAVIVAERMGDDKGKRNNQII